MAFDATRSDAVNAVTSIYAQVGHAAGADEFNDMDNRIRNGQTMAELVANTWDDAQRRFKVADTPTTRAQEAAGRLPTYDAQNNQGRSFEPPAAIVQQFRAPDPPAIMLEQLALPAREQGPMMNGSPLVSAQRSTPSNTPRYNIGPADASFGGAAGGGMLGGLSMGTILMIGGGLIVALVLFRKMERGGNVADDPNPAATLYAATVAVAANAAAGPPTVATDEILTIQGTLGGTLPENPSEIINLSAPAVMAPAFDPSGLIKLAILVVVALWAGNLLFSDRGR